MNMSPVFRTVIIAIDDSEYAEFAFDCKYDFFCFMHLFVVVFLYVFIYLSISKILFYLLINGRASSKILVPPEKKNCYFGFFFFFFFFSFPRLIKFQNIP